MMTFQQLSSLIKQGYNEDQIKQLNAIFSPEPAPEPTTTPNPSPAPAPAPDQSQTQPAPGGGTASQHGPTPPSQQTTPEQQPSTQPPTQPQPESETQKMLKEMLGIMRTGAINNLQQPTTPPVTTESILAKVLEP